MHFVFDQPNIEYFLREHQALGAHTDIIQFQSGKMTTFKWTHTGTRPLGFGINPQCPSCKRLKTNSPKANKNYSEIVLQCSECKATQVFTFPSGWKWMHGPPPTGKGLKDERGAWLVQVLDEVHQMDTT